MAIAAFRILQVGGKPDFADPVVLSADRGGTTVEHLCRQIHRTLADELNFALVWGTSSKHYPQRYAPISSEAGAAGPIHPEMG